MSDNKKLKVQISIMADIEYVETEFTKEELEQYLRHLSWSDSDNDFYIDRSDISWKIEEISEPNNEPVDPINRTPLIMEGQINLGEVTHA